MKRQFPDPEQAASYLEEIHRLHPRYIRDQLQLIQKTLDQASTEAVDQALRYCVTNRLYRAVDFADAVKSLLKIHARKRRPDPVDVKPLSGMDPAKWKAKPHIRDMEIYQRILRGG